MITACRAPWIQRRGWKPCSGSGSAFHHTAQLGRALGDEINEILDPLVDAIEEFMECDEVRVFRIPVRFLAFFLQIDSISSNRPSPKLTVVSRVAFGTSLLAEYTIAPLNRCPRYTAPRSVCAGMARFICQARTAALTFD